MKRFSLKKNSEWKDAVLIVKFLEKEFIETIEWPSEYCSYLPIWLLWFFFSYLELILVKLGLILLQGKQKFFIKPFLAIRDLNCASNYQWMTSPPTKLMIPVQFRFQFPFLPLPLANSVFIWLRWRGNEKNGEAQIRPFLQVRTETHSQIDSKHTHLTEKKANRKVDTYIQERENAHS